MAAVEREARIGFARCILEAVSPLSIGSGKADLEHDVVIVRDAHGLPTIPGSALAGVLRSAYTAVYGAERAADLFGTLRRDVGEDEVSAGGRSRLTVSWGAVHDQKGMAVDGPVRLRSNDLADPVLDLLLRSQPVKRDHVRLNERGLVDGEGKYDRGAAPAGTRFTVQLEFEGPEPKATLMELLLLLKANIELGGATRRGYGELKLKRYWLAEVPLKKGAAKLLQAWRGSLSKPPPQSVQSESANRLDRRNRPIDWTEIELQLQTEDYWVVGGGRRAIGKDDADQKPPHLLPYTENYISWSEGYPSEGKPYWGVVLPGAGLKGALRHRTAFHLRRLIGFEREADVVGLLEQLFGAIRDDGGKDETGRIGSLIVRDVIPTNKKKPGEKSKPRQQETPVTNRLMHNGIDRFTGGVRRGVLFSEEVLFRSQLWVSCRIHGSHHAPVLRRAFREALLDLAEGRLPIGGGSARGHGYLQYADNASWPAEFDTSGHWLCVEAAVEVPEHA